MWRRRRRRTARRRTRSRCSTAVAGGGRRRRGEEGGGAEAAVEEAAGTSAEADLGLAPQMDLDVGGVAGELARREQYVELTGGYVAVTSTEGPRRLLLRSVAQFGRLAQPMPDANDLEAGGASVPGSVKSTKSTLTVSAVDVVDGVPDDVRRSDKRWSAPAADDGGDGDAPPFTAGSLGGFEVAEVASPEMSPEPQPAASTSATASGAARPSCRPTSSSDGAPPGFGGDGEPEAPPPPSSLASGHPKLLFLHSLSSRAMVGGPNSPSIRSGRPSATVPSRPSSAPTAP